MECVKHVAVKKLEHQDRIDIPELPEDAGSFLIIHQGEQ